MKYAKNVSRQGRGALSVLAALYGPEVKIATLKISDGLIQVAPFAGSVDEEWVAQAKLLIDKNRVGFYLPEELEGAVPEESPDPLPDPMPPYDWEADGEFQ